MGLKTIPRAVFRRVDETGGAPRYVCAEGVEIETRFEGKRSSSAGGETSTMWSWIKSVTANDRCSFPTPDPYIECRALFKELGKQCLEAYINQYFWCASWINRCRVEQAILGRFK